MSISAVIITKNSDTHLDKVLKSVKKFDEVLVCDLGSTDKTLHIAAENGAHIIPFNHKEKATHADARNFAVKSARSRWVLFLEPDEYITEEMPEKLYDFIHDADNQVRGLYLPRKTFFFNRFNAVAYPDYHLRFFNKEVTFWDDVEAHEPQVHGIVHKMPASNHNYAIHQIPHALSEIITSINQETDNAAQSSAKKISVFNLLFQPFNTFLNYYFLRGGIMYGMSGFIGSCHESIKKYYTLAKSHEAAIKSPSHKNSDSYSHDKDN